MSARSADPSAPAPAGPAAGPLEAPARRAAIVVKWGFERYRSLFRRITRRAQTRFEQEDWHGVDRDMRERLALYTRVVRRVVREIGSELGAGTADEALWARIKLDYGELVAGRADVELAETFFNSVTRRIFPTIGVNPAREFVRFGGSEEPPAGAAPVRTYPAAASSAPVLRQILDDCPFSIPWRSVARDAALGGRLLDEALARAWGDAGYDYIETLEPLFFRARGAFVVGRVVRGERHLPLLLALLVEDGRVRLDAVLPSEEEASVAFSFTRSYFKVDVENPSGTIRFLRRILPRKPIAEIYNAIGYDRHGKTVLYRELRRHVTGAAERFDFAPGEPGLVVVTFAMPGFDVVFKVLRDRFGPGKSMSHDDVRRRYRFVAEHDRAGRLVDVQEFEHLELPADRFEPRLLDELRSETAGDVTVEPERVIFRRVWTERRVTPLNLYLRDAGERDSERAVRDFGQTLRDLAATNVFPGDLPIKNFGVTRHGRVVFYDYDEISRVTDCDFRSLPEAEWSDPDEAPIYARPNDIFPEELLRFLGLPRPLRDRFAELHGELLTPRWWNRMKERLAGGERIDVFPYRPERRLDHRLDSSGGNPA